jgi:glycosyltransferase involved in cell wall biosynthesis
MRLLFVTAHPYLPQLRGGMQSSADELCIQLKHRGHRVAVLAGLTPEGPTGWRSRVKMQINKRRSGCKVARDTVSEYPVWRTWFAWDAMDYVADKERPDLIVIMAGEPVRMGLAAKRTRIPILIQLQDVVFNLLGGRFEDLGNVPCVANSRFTADRYRSAFGVNSTVIYPFITSSKYKIDTTRENVTFINPHPVKGRDIAVGIAALCPEIPFTFVEGWRLSDDHRSQLMQSLAKLPNVKFIPPQTDMRAVYGKSRILLAPTVIEEAYGRVATEAQLCGVPVVASSCGGLPEAVGPGGILLDPNQPIADWAAAVRKLWNDKRHYAELSAAALAHAQRREMSLDYQIDAWENAMLTACGHNPPAFHLAAATS